ncbi:DUF1615 family protein [Candidatus Peregrinibacteria bacterium]|nr:MAG: DUF1615 family protein [Candidatus Peregrinibacteria bacterium]
MGKPEEKYGKSVRALNPLRRGSSSRDVPSASSRGFLDKIRSHLRKGLVLAAFGGIGTGGGIFLEQRLKLGTAIAALSEHWGTPTASLPSSETEIESVQEPECGASEWELTPPPQAEALEPALAKRALQSALEFRFPNDEVEAGRWANALVSAMEKERYPLTVTKMALLLAFIETESDFQVDPAFTSGQVRSEISDTIEAKEKQYPGALQWAKDLGIYDDYEPFLDRAKAAKSEGSVLKILHDGIDALKAEGKENTRALIVQRFGEDWEFLALGLVHSLGPTQINAWNTFSLEERKTLTPDQLRMRQLELLNSPETGIQYTVRLLKALQEVYGNDLPSVIGDYKGGPFAHFKAKIQVILQGVTPDLEVDGDLVFYTAKGLPDSTRDSSTLLAAFQFNEKHELGFEDEQIREAFAKTGKDLMEDCVVRSILQEGQELGVDLNVRLQTSKGEGSAKARQTVEEYVDLVTGRYREWLERLKAAKFSHTKAVEPVASAKTSGSTKPASTSSSKAKVIKASAVKPEAPKEKEKAVPTHTMPSEAQFNAAYALHRGKCDPGLYVYYFDGENGESGEVRVSWEIARSQFSGYEYVVRLTPIDGDNSRRAVALYTYYDNYLMKAQRKVFW